VRPLALPPSGYDGTSPKSIASALVLSVLLHAALWQAAPASLGIVIQADAPAPFEPRVAIENTPPEEIPEELLPEELRPPKPRFVQVNPEAPTRNPPDTLNTGAATQRAAQPVPDGTERAPLPKLDGEEAESTQLVNHIPREFLPPEAQPQPDRPLGQPAPDTTAPTPVSKTAVAQKAQETDGPAPAQARPEFTPAVERGGIAVSVHPGKAPLKPEVPEDTGAVPVNRPSAQKNSGERDGTDAQKNTPAPQSAPANAAPKGDADDLPAPRPRPQAVKVGTTGILMKNPYGTNEAGTLSLDAKYSEFGDYAQRMIEIIQASWWVIIERSKIHEQYGAVVVIEFTLCRDGTLKDVVVASTTASASGTYACKDAIESRTPFDPWRADMVAMLGDEERSKFTFHYR
jgi:hypothetical protein